MSVVLTVAVLMALEFPGRPPSAGREVRAEGPGESYRRWIDDLADDNPVIRDAAADRLKAAGRAAWADLEAACASHPDLECRSRARDLLDTSRRRRTLSHLVLEEHPSALQTLDNGATAEKLRLIRTLGRNFETCSEILLDLLRDSDPEIVIATAEVLQENRNYDWTARLLDLFAAEEVPRQSRVFELLASAYARVQSVDLQRSFDRSGPRARVRFVQLALHANLALSISPQEIRSMLRLGDSSSQRAALAWLRERGPTGGVPEVEPLLSAADSAVVADALSTLRQLHYRLDSEALACLLEHEDPGVRDEATQAVVSFEERACLPALCSLLRDPSTAIRQTALAAIWKLDGAQACPTVFELFLRDSGDSRDQAAALLATAREWTLPRARALLRDPDPERRIRGYDLLSRIEGPAVLFGLAGDLDESVRRWGLAQILRRLEAPRAIETVESFAGDSSESVRFEALRALVRLGRREHAGGLAGFLSSREYTLRYDAAETLLEHAGDRASGIARALLGESDGPLRRLALNSMADRSDREGIERALADLSDSDSRLRRAAASYLGKILGIRRDAPLVARLAAALDGYDGETLGLAFRLVVENGDASTSAAIRKLIVSSRAPSSDRAIRALADWGGEQATVELSSLLGEDAAVDESLFMRLREVRARHPAVGTRELEAGIRRLLSAADRRVRRMALGAAEEHRLATDALLGMLEDPAASVRDAAIGACARLGLEDAAAPIEARFDDEDPEVRIAAVLAYAKLRPFDPKPVDRAVASEDCGWAKRRMELALKK